MDNKKYPNLQNWINSGCPVTPIKTRNQLNEVNNIIQEATAAKAAGDTTAIDDNALSNLISDAEYAGERHWTFQWKIIAGAILSVLLLSWWGSSKDDDVKEQSQVVTQIEAWTPCDTVVTLESLKGNDINTFPHFEARLNSAAKYKYYYALIQANYYYGVQESIEREEARRDRITDPKQKQYAAENVEKLKSEKAEKELKFKTKFERIMNLDFDGVKQMALEEINGKVEEKESSSRTVKFWFWFVLICIPLYIIACRPYGYTLTRHAVEADTLNTIHRFGLWASGGLVGAAAAIQFTEIITKWSDGSTTTSDNGTGPAKMVLKIALIAGAVILFCLVSCFILAYATITGLIRNYDWKAIFNKLKKHKNTPVTNP